ncbi:undecaprenyldiphospho-muramoylpentapeptide beta-N-acetylglucosaminyltransferase [Thiomicrorhabdus arctica]|jgi:UDP-N-acetylglucosamine--N-acetylmuramyl-(pentapeptide) pyrophosphoryl-undecaprenol N-acetylglucosamine transferase|uniref:undecaprenyldiphospho-muramoylpentapeptide beta-N-acetylglucosaminyltransferase n=1 Tax=Thiomicrorhabdus arctica TaxID=131540 RepID=UPI00037F204F|nr:undecaprenyldiphospho-muramoylpentapeptide beta-N-acetylglucosaminyltransferase [Thiomicrorhabdus arctica]
MSKVLIMAGGTGGHVFPGIALAEALKLQGVEVVWLGTQGGMEAEWVKKAHIPLHTIKIKGLRGNGWTGWLKAPINVSRAWSQAKQILQQEQPDLVLGMGGFVCGPGGLAAKALGIPLVLHEQNAIPGLTNKLLAPLAKLVITAFPQEKLKGKKVLTLGNPVRAGLESLLEVENTQPCHLLVLGGSRGALALNETLPKALALMDENDRPIVTHQAGGKTFEKASEAYQATGMRANVVPFIDNMLKAYATADMVLCRSGALTVSELMASARPAIMVPYPHAVDDHQTANAMALVKIGGGEILQQKDLTAESLATLLHTWCQDSEKRALASQSIRAHAETQATEKIVEQLLKIIQIERRSK